MTIVDQQTSTREIETPPESDWEPRIVAFICSWCSYTGADLAGTAGAQYPPNVRLIRVPCAGRLDLLFVLESLQRGIDGVLVVGCPPDHCHYGEGNLLAQRRFRLLKGLLEHVGVEPGRLHFSWVGASEGPKFARVASEVVESVRSLGPSRTLVRGMYAASRSALVE